jgi:hypothetical protein
MSKQKINGTAVELPNGVKVHCPEDGGKMQNPVTVDFNGGEIVCHDARSLVNAISMTLAQFLAAGRKQGDGKQGTGPQRSWAEAAEYAERHNKGKPESEHITADEARKILAREKKKQKLEAALKLQPAKPAAKKTKK